MKLYSLTSLYQHVILCLIGFFIANLVLASNSIPISEEEKIAITKKLEQLPTLFRKNMGQFNESVLYKTISEGINLQFLQNGISHCVKREISDSKISEKVYPYNPISPRFKLPKAQSSQYEYLVWNLYFEGMNKTASIIGFGQTESKANYFHGNDPNKWVINVPDYKLLRYKNVYNNIDLQYYAIGNSLKYDFIIHPGGSIK